MCKSTQDAMTTRQAAAEPSLTARYSCAGLVVAIFSVWGRWAHCKDDARVPGGSEPLHSVAVPLTLVALYLASLPLLRRFTDAYLSRKVDVKALLTESMILYNGGQVLLNGWMVYKFLYALVFRGHPFVGGHASLIDTGATYAVWVHYVDKYLEFLDTFFMILRGRMDQVSRLPCLSLSDSLSLSVSLYLSLSICLSLSVSLYICLCMD
jgi:elongation of very long chain fatty acids protein 4